ncbi:MAG TPA: addiction module protein [Gemmataceae bacterium]|nr:addiction module protein [Gemmataceae bacterium]
MTLETALAEIAAWPVEERIRLVQAVWDTIAADQVPDLTEDQKREFDRRIADLDANPSNVLTWEQIKARVRGRE